MDLVDERVTVQEFEAAEKEVNKRNHFFPVMADILETVEKARDMARAQRAEIARKREQERLALPDLTEAEIEYNKKMLAELMSQIRPVDGY